MMFNTFLKSTSFEEFYKTNTTTISPDKADEIIEEGKTLFEVIEDFASEHRLGRAYALLMQALERFFFDNPKECTSQSMSLIGCLIEKLQEKNLRGLEEKRLEDDESSTTCPVLPPHKATWTPLGWNGSDQCLYLSNRSALVATRMAAEINAVTLSEATHSVIDSSATKGNVYTYALLSSVLFSGEGNISMAGYENFAAVIGGSNTSIQANGYQNNVFNTGAYTRITVSGDKAGNVYSSGAYAKINLLGWHPKSHLPCVFSFGRGAVITSARYTHACFVRGEDARLFLQEKTRYLLLGKGVKLFTYCLDECEQRVPVVLEGGKDLEADKVYEWDEDAKWFKGLPYPYSIPE